MRDAQDFPTVLVVDDEPLLRMSLTDLLQRAGFRVKEAAQAAEALLIIEGGEDVDVVVTDIQMPGAMDGLQLASHLRTVYPNLRIIICSGAVFPEEKRLPHGAIFMAKPVNHAALLQQIQPF